MFAILTAAPYFSDRRRGCFGLDDYDPAAAVLCGEAGGDSVSSGLAGGDLCAVPAGVGSATGADVGSHGAEAAADREPDGDAGGVSDHGVRAKSLGGFPGAGDRWGDGGEFVAGA